MALRLKRRQQVCGLDIVVVCVVGGWGKWQARRWRRNRTLGRGRTGQRRICQDNIAFPSSFALHREVDLISIKFQKFSVILIQEELRLWPDIHYWRRWQVLDPACGVLGPPPPRWQDVLSLQDVSGLLRIHGWGKQQGLKVHNWLSKIFYQQLFCNYFIRMCLSAKLQLLNSYLI